MIKNNSNLNKEKYLFKSYVLNHKTNPHKLNLLFDLYRVYKVEYKNLIYSQWHHFIHNKYHLISTHFLSDYHQVNSTDYLALFNNIINHKPFVFTHLGSTKHIETQLNASYLQACLQQVSSTLNGYLSAIQNRFNLIISKSSLNNKQDKYNKIKHTNKDNEDNSNDNNKYKEDMLHQLRTINLNRAWLHQSSIYFPLSKVIDN